MSKRKREDDGPNTEFCNVLNELAEYERNVNRQIHKYNAYRKAAAVLLKHPTRITSGKEARTLPGIGEKIAKKLDEYIQTGKLAKLEKIRDDDLNLSIGNLMKVSGVGPVAAKKFVDDGIKTIEDLKNIEDQLNHHQRIGLKYFEDFEERIPRTEMLLHQKFLHEEVTKVDTKYTIEICGSFRRGKPSSGDIDVLICHPNFTSQTKADTKSDYLKQVVDHLKARAYITDVLSQGALKFMGVCLLNQEEGLPGLRHRRLDIRLIPAEQFYCGVLYFTGSDEFNREMRQYALDKGFTLNEYNVRPLGTTGIPGESVPVTCEQDIFDVIGMKYRLPNERDL
ncbi:DNA polymerase beta-like [Xenia sp. Carnegie-2017]|uniref:DNA polymerase beta-like n=1 Tax=Xenia sp. Carnegie-2017 TaxID=2897299 RepID=UPI001F034ACF|nr:DNA polymerase beta-like [Xenia sp. Carnegie-2017]